MSDQKKPDDPFSGLDWDAELDEWDQSTSAPGGATVPESFSSAPSRRGVKSEQPKPKKASASPAEGVRCIGRRRSAQALGRPRPGVRPSAQGVRSARCLRSSTTRTPLRTRSRPRTAASGSSSGRRRGRVEPHRGRDGLAGPARSARGGRDQAAIRRPQAGRSTSNEPRSSRPSPARPRSTSICWGSRTSRPTSTTSPRPRTRPWSPRRRTSCIASAPSSRRSAARGRQGLAGFAARRPMFDPFKERPASPPRRRSARSSTAPSTIRSTAWTSSPPSPTPSARSCSSQRTVNTAPTRRTDGLRQEDPRRGRSPSADPERPKSPHETPDPFALKDPFAAESDDDGVLDAVEADDALIEPAGIIDLPAGLNRRRDAEQRRETRCPR